MASVTLERVGKRYPGGVEAVIDVSLQVDDGAFVTLVGPSGCGKSTTLQLIAGLEAPTSGEVLFDGEAVTRLSPRERDVAMVFQSYALYPHKTVYENLAFPLRIARRPGPEIDRHVREAAHLLEIEPLLDRRPRALSGGQRQRVALGRALVRRPRVFLFDEPLSNLDAALRVQMRAELKRLHARLDTTFIYVTHDQTEAMTLSDRVAVFSEGRLQQLAPPREIYERPANVFVARFLGAPAINLLRGRVEEGALAWPGGRLPLPEGARLPPSGAELVAGWRSEALRCVSPEEGDLRGRIFLVEPMGPETFVTVETPEGDRLTAREPSDFAGTMGEPVGVAIQADRVHLFDAATERRLGS